jgi:hypothetical protein
MKHISKLMVAALALGSSAWLAAAQTENPTPPEGGPPHGPGMGPHRFPPAFLKALDANADGVIDTDEIANATAALTALDSNKDGQLTRDEVFGPRPDAGQAGDEQRPPRPAGPPPGAGAGAKGPLMPPVLAALDTDHNGVISADELAKASEALKTLDKNGDGQLTPDEFHGPRGPGGPGMGGRGRFHGPPPGDGPPPAQDAPQQQ